MNRTAPLLLVAALALGVSPAAAQLLVKPNVAPVVANQLPNTTHYQGTVGIIDLSSAFRDPDASAAVRLTTSLGVMNFTLDGETAPITVANFLRYVDEGRYFIHDNTTNQQASLFFHRSVPGFVIQSGGFMGTVHPNGSGNLLASQVPAFAPIQNEPVISNRRATIAMAKLGGDPNSATSQWFINLADNSANLDFQNGGFSVFGRVAGNGMAVADAIAALPVRNFGFFDQLPVRNYTSPNPARLENLVSIPGFNRISPFVFTATSNNPTSAEVSVSGTNLLVRALQPGPALLTVTATDLDGASISQSLDVSIVAAPGRLRNISTRGRIPAGDAVMIGGFIVRGGPSHNVVVRAIGPSLTDRGVANALADTTIELHGANGLIASNDNWAEGPDQQLITDIGIAPENPREAALFAKLPASADAFTAYTAIVRSKDGTSGIGLVEIFDLEAGAGSTLRNLSTRGPVAAGEPLIGGLILQGANPNRLVVRAIGMSLPPEVGTRLPNPMLELRDANGTVVDQNDDWQTHPDAAEIRDLGLAPGDATESALIRRGQSAPLTALITGAGGAPNGVALIEVFAVE